MGTPMGTRYALDMLAELRSEIEHLVAENDRLRADYERLRAACNAAIDTMISMRAVAEDRESLRAVVYTTEFPDEWHAELAELMVSDHYDACIVVLQRAMLSAHNT